MIQVFLKVPESEYWDGERSSLPIEAIETIRAAKGQFADDPCRNTKPYNGYKIILFIGDTTIERVKGFIELYSLDWEILAHGTETETIQGYDSEIDNYIVKPGAGLSHYSGWVELSVLV